MIVNSALNNASQLRRENPESQRSDKDKSDPRAAAIESVSIQQAGSSRDGEVLKELGDRASREWEIRDRFFNKIIDIGSITDILSGTSLTDLRAAKLFAEVNTDKPTLTTNEGGFDVNVSQGPEGSIYLNLGNGAEVFIFTDSSGQQIAYHVENGELGERISGEGSTDIGNDIRLSIDESAAGDSEINFRQGSNSLTRLLNRPPIMTLNSDNSMLTTKHREGSGLSSFFSPSEVNSFDIHTGEQLVVDGAPDLDKMSSQQQFDYYADTPEGTKILEVEGNHYSGDLEKRLFVARVRYEREEGGPELFNEFTPRRATLEGDDLAAYDAAVLDMMNEIREQGVQTVEGPDGVSIEMDEPLSESLLYIVASSTVESYGESPESIDAIQADIDKWILSTDNFDGIPIRNAAGDVIATSAGWYNSSRGEVQFSIGSLVRDYVQPEDIFELVTHELAHSLDNVDGPLDGIPPGLSEEQTQLLIDERDRLFDEAYPDGLMRDERGNYEYTTVVDSNGFRDYTFYNEKEFWAELSATFLSSDAGADIVKHASPELYNMLREYYGREDLQAAWVSSK